MMNTSIRKNLMFGCAALLSVFALWSAQAAMNPDLIAQGDQQWAAGQLDAAQRTFEQAVQAEPRSVKAHMKLAGLQLSRQDFAASIATYQRSIGLNAHNDKAWLGLGFAYLHTGQNGLSLAAFNEAVRIEPGHQEALAAMLVKLATP
ncbi:tetratricopeptide repeat protein [Rhodoferax sp.]|uniref:tetratricopeptide repeat protein n=1 Tax=Rhodoferax sp. TaxID=50421 RepID=UPI0019F56401|nr:tetratricopeptide repeat protein [Rhodoferax sp.]MBE0474952.1 tetratricopeptide repeat protein [Rhodoferax sp.]